MKMFLHPKPNQKIQMNYSQMVPQEYQKYMKELEELEILMNRNWEELVEETKTRVEKLEVILMEDPKEKPTTQMIQISKEQKRNQNPSGSLILNQS